VAKTARGAEEAHERLSAVALEHEMTVLMANCLGPCGGNRCVGRSAVWRADGTLAEEIEGDDAALLGIDTRTEETFRAAL
jgi:predicted amidohydrolase